MVTVLINIIGFLLIACIVWWFWLSKSHFNYINVHKLIEIKVKDGVYQPSFIKASVNQPFTLRFIREDVSPCAEVVVFDSLSISRQLPVNQPVDIHLNIKNAGVHEFTCQMRMYRGKLSIT